jgi:hypothetical protein
MPPRTEQTDQPGDGQHQQKGIASLLDSMALAPAPQPRRKDIKDKYAFWESQPVMQFNDEGKVNMQTTATAVQYATVSMRLQPVSLVCGVKTGFLSVTARVPLHVSCDTQFWLACGEQV